MTDKEYNEQKRRIQKLATKWVGPLGLKWWKINISYHREKSETPTSYMPIKNGEYVCFMTTTAEPNYLVARIDAYLSEIIDLNDDELEEAFVHELMHIFVSPMSTEIKKKSGDEERVATTLSRAFRWVRQENE